MQHGLQKREKEKKKLKSPEEPQTDQGCRNVSSDCIPFFLLQ